MPPPWSARPSMMLRWSRVTLAPLLMEKTRLTPLPLTLRSLRPWIARLSVMDSSPLERAMAPLSPPWKAMVSAPGLALAAVIAARNEPAPASPRLRTLNVLGRLRSSSLSSQGRNDGRERGADDRRAVRDERPVQELRNHMID